MAVACLVAAALFLMPDSGPEGPEGDWELSFSDDFDGDRLDRDRWNDHEPWQDDGWTTNAAHYPVPHATDQLEVSDGIAELRARRADGGPEGTTFTSADLNTRGTFSIPDGATSFTEARLRAPKSKGLLPAFWLLGDGTEATGQGWPITGEVDILEFANNEDEAGRPYASVWYPKDVYTDPPGTFMNGVHDTHPDSFDAEPDLRGGWHTWGLFRSPERMDVYVDGVRRFTFEPGDVYEQGMPLPEMLFTEAAHIRLSLGVGGDWAGAGWQEDEYEEGELQVDFVRSWLLED